MELPPLAVPDLAVMQGFGILPMGHDRTIERDGDGYAMVCSCSNRVPLGPSPTPDTVLAATDTCAAYIRNYLEGGPDAHDDRQSGIA